MNIELNYGDVIYRIIQKLVLLCGDIFVDSRASAIDSKFKFDKVVQHVLCTGNIGNKATLDRIDQICPDVHIVKGQYDDYDLPEFKVIQIGNWKIFLIHGHQIVPWGDEETLSVYLKEHDADIAVFGNTHQARVSKLERRYYINPGTLTGAYGPLISDPIPEFIILEVLGNDLAVFKYKLVNGDLQIEKSLISK